MTLVYGCILLPERKSYVAGDIGMRLDLVPERKSYVADYIGIRLHLAT